MKTNAPISYIFSWHWNREDFSSQWEFLNRKTDSGSGEHGETIWQTRFKEVQLLSVPSADGEYRIALKNYHEKRFFRYFCRPSLTAREAEGFALVKSLGIPVAEVLAFGEKRCFFNLINAYFITAYEEGTETLLYFKKHPEQHEQLLKLLTENIKYLAKLHAAGYIHGGAHPRNFLWKPQDAGEDRSIWIDLATVRKTPGGKKYWKYILTDLSDFTEVFHLTQAELDQLADEYRKINNIPIAYKIRNDHERKFSIAVRVN